jgi:glycosyltransferase involved in cell wall biosynthesis
MKILLINKFLFPKGGDAISTLTTGNILKSFGNEVLLWGMDHPTNPPYPFSDLFVSNVDYEDSGGFFSKAKAAMRILYSFEAQKKMSILLEKCRPDIVHLNNFAHQIGPSILYEIKKRHIPIVMTMRDYKMVCPTYRMLFNGDICERCKHGAFYNCGIRRCTKGSLSKSILNVVEMYLHHKILRVYDKIDLFISPSLFLKRKVEEMGLKGNVIYLSNCVDVDCFHPTYDWNEESIVYVGRLSHEKGIITLIDAVKGLDVNLKIIGDGPLKENLQAKTISDHIDNISFLGHIAGQELHDEIRKSIFLVIPSEWYENNPRTVIEAFALGKPAIGARIGGIPELVRDWETGFTFTSGDVVDLRNKITLMLDNKTKIAEMGKKARRHVEKELNSKVYYGKLTDIYKSLLDDTA